VWQEYDEEDIMILRSGRWIVGAVAVSLAAGACKNSTTTTTPTGTLSSFAISGTPPAIGATSQFSATAKLTDGTTQDVTSSTTWTSSDANVATVSAAGLVAGLAAGDVKISGTYQNTTSSSSFHLGHTTATVGSIVVTGFAPSTGGTSQFTATANYADGTSEDVTSGASWTSSSSSVATVSSAGLVTGVAPGAVTISAKYNSVTGSTTVVVGATLTSVVVSGTAPSVGAGNQFTATARFADGSVQDVTSQATWTSSNTSVATVSSGGLVTGVAAGVVTISAKYQSLTGTATFNIVGS
jgi:uncharacterized protein YjdB